MSHLGGHYGRTSMLISIFDCIKDNKKINSVIDIGCGPGGMVQYINYSKIYCIGIDGDITIKPKEYIKFHDYTHGFLELDEVFDLAYSVEFLEHVESKYIPNFMPTFQKCNYVFCSAAHPGQGGYHHVNEQPLEYWIKIFDEYGFDHDDYMVNELKKVSRDQVIQKNGMFFKNRNFEQNIEKKDPFIIDENDFKDMKNEINIHVDGLGQDIVGFKRWD